MAKGFELVARVHYYLEVVPRIWILVVSFALGVAKSSGGEPLAFDKLIALEGKEFVTAADESGYGIFGTEQLYTVDQLIAVAEKLLPSVKPYGERSEDDGLNPFTSYFEPACDKANDEQLDKLIALYRRLDPNTFEKSNALPQLASRVLARQIAAMAVQPAQIPEDDSIALPAKVQSAPKELQSAWRLFQRAKASFTKAFPQPTEMNEQIEVSANMKSFYNLVGEALSGATGKENEIRAFAWTGANCLGISDIEDAQDIALLLMLLREGRMNEAIGAALSVAGTTGSTSQPEACAKPVIDLLTRCGLDWEQIFAGGQVEEEVRGWGGENRGPYLSALIKHGSPGGAGWVRTLAHFAKPERRTPYVAAFSGWIGTSAKRSVCGDIEVSLDLGITGSADRVAKAMPEAVQAAALHDVEEFATPDSPEGLAMHAINVFIRTQATSSIPTLKRLTRHSSPKVAQDAALILCVMGERVKIPPLGSPVRFQILANGKPLPKDLQVAWRIGSEGGTVSSNATVLADGVVELPRAHFTLPDRRATSVEFSANTLAEGGVIFKTRLSPPWGLDELTKIDVKISSLEIVLRNREGLNAPPSDKAFVGLSPVEDDKMNPMSGGPPSEVFSHSQTGSSLFREDNEMSATPSIRLPAVKEGKYRVWIGVPGSEIWRETISVGSKGTRVEAKLNPGSDLRFRIITPNGQRTTWASLFKGGREMNANTDSQDNTYQALPCGHYVLRIPPSDYFERERPDLKTKRGPDEIPYKGREVSFTVEKGSPTVIDLGEIRLEPAE
jgi:hypothetical protein